MASDGTYWYIDCSQVIEESDTYLEDVQVTTAYAIGQCLEDCVAWKANVSNIVQCQYGQIQNPTDMGEDADQDTDCSLWGEPVAGSPGDSDRYEFALTTNATQIAGAVPVVCPSPNSPVVISRSAVASSSSSTTSSSTILTPTPTPTNPVGCAEAALCPDDSGQVRQGSDGQYYQIDCVNCLLESDTYVTDFEVDSQYAIGQCIAGCDAWNTDPSNAGAAQCDYGQMEQGQAYCSLFGNSFNDGDTGEPSNRYEFAVTTDPTLIAGAYVCQAAAA
ncbi:hypothetical protein LTR85_006928 [Meristemomyces frigidus]|nr:hypothetical protein LTR85_006928 [Meristemomyces frigidus]